MTTGWPRLVAIGLALLAPSTARAQGPAIEHKAVGCLVAEQFPRLDACFAPTSEVARARVHFRTHGTPHWYFVDMKPDGTCHSGVLPKPKKSTKKIDYYIDVVDRRFAEGRTREHDPRVVEKPGECRKDILVAAATGSASILLGIAAGAPPIPVGFESAGIAGAIGPGTAVSGAGAPGSPTSPATSGGEGPSVAAGKGGGGGGTAAAFLLGAGAAGGAAYYLTHRDKGDTGPTYDGEWSGTTSQNRSFAFTVAQNAVVRVDTSYQLTANATTLVPIQKSFSPGLSITSGRFTYQEPGLLLTGVFASETSSSGRIEATRTTISWQATKR